MGVTENPGKGILLSDLAVRNRLQESLLVESQYEKIMCRLQSDNDETEEVLLWNGRQQKQSMSQT